MKNIALIGMMGCGKTTCGVLLSQRLGRKLVDTDAQIEARQGCTIAEIFAEKGEAYFRELEQAVAEELGRERNLIIACGGGLPLRPECVAGLRPNSVVVWLRRDPGETYDTMDVSGRPLAQQGREAFLARFAQREPLYRRAADVTVTDFTSEEATVREIIGALSRLEGVL